MLNVSGSAVMLIGTLLVFVVIDYLAGVMCAVSNRKLSSAVGFKGICRKVLIFLLAGLAHILDTQVLHQEGVLRTAVVFFFLANDGLSILENAAHLGLPIPEQLKQVLEQLHDRAEKSDNGNQIEAQRSGFDLKRTSSGATELSAPATEANGCAACEDAEQLHDRDARSGELQTVDGEVVDEEKR